MSAVAATLWGDVEAHPDHHVLRLHGDLSPATVAKARALVGKLLRDKGAVVVDLAGLRLRWAPAAELFAGALAAAGGWPAARLVLTGADPDLASRLRALRVPNPVPVVADLAAAVASLWRRPERVTRHRDLPPALTAPGAARDLVRQACADWHVRGAEDTAALVVSELVTNVVQHTRGPCRVSVGIGPCGLHVGVRDYAPGPAPRPRPVELTHPGGRGLHIIAMLANAWGVHQHSDGKTIWAVIAVPD